MENRRDLPEITGMRGLAAFLVVGFHGVILFAMAGGDHTTGAIAPFFTAGWVGVDLFFVLSAFLLAMPLLRKANRVGEPSFWQTYMAKRILRIAPPYLVSIPLMLVVLDRVAYFKTNAWDVVLHALYLHSFDFHSFTSIQGPYWTLAIEFQFYLVLPLFALLFSRQLWPYATAGALALSIAWRAAVYDPSDLARTFWLAGQLPGFIGHFAVGVAAARLYLDGQAQQALRAAGAWGLSAGFLAVPVVLLTDGWSAFPTMGTGLASNALLRPLLAVGFGAFVLAVTSRADVPRRLLGSRPVEGLGKMSYSVYLTHTPIGFLAVPHLGPVVPYGIGAFMIALFAITIAGSALFYVAVERPSLRLKVWKTEPRRAPTEGQPLRAPVPSLALPTGHPEPVQA